MVVDSHQRGSTSGIEPALVPYLPGLSGAPIAVITAIVPKRVVAVVAAMSMLWAERI